MDKLNVVLKEDIGKTSYELRSFFEKMVENGELNAYLVEVNKETIEKDTEKERVIRIKKGATLTPTKKLPEYEQILIEDSSTKVMYNLEIASRGGEFYDDGDRQTIYHECALKRLKDFDPQKIEITRLGFFGEKKGIFISSKMVNARLKIDYNEHWVNECSDIGSITRKVVIEGELDPLFKKVYEFVKKK